MDATAASPAKTTTTYTFPSEAKEVETRQDKAIVIANERAPDQTVALKKLDNHERRILLYVAIVSLALGVAAKSLIPAWPGASTTCFIVAGILGAAWKFSEVPWWAALGVAALYLAIAGGYKRGEVDANGNGIPDRLEKKDSTRQ